MVKQSGQDYVTTTALTFDEHDLQVGVSVCQPSGNNAACGATTRVADQKDGRSSLHDVLTRIR